MLRFIIYSMWATSHSNVTLLVQPRLTLENSILTSFSEEGQISVTVQASNGRSTVQDSKTVRVYGEFMFLHLIHMVEVVLMIVIRFHTVTSRLNTHLIQAIYLTSVWNNLWSDILKTSSIHVTQAEHFTSSPISQVGRNSVIVFFCLFVFLLQKQVFFIQVFLWIFF